MLLAVDDMTLNRLLLIDAADMRRRASHIRRATAAEAAT